MRILKQIAQSVIFIALVTAAGAGSALAAQETHVFLTPTSLDDMKVDVANKTITGNRQVSVTVSHSDPPGVFDSPSGAFGSCGKVRYISVGLLQDVNTKHFLSQAKINNSDGLCTFNSNDYSPSLVVTQPDDAALYALCNNQPGGTVNTQVNLNVILWNDSVFSDARDNKDVSYPVRVTCVVSQGASSAPIHNSSSYGDASSTSSGQTGNTPSWGSSAAKNAAQQKGGHINPEGASTKEKTQANMKLDTAQANAAAERNKMNWGNQAAANAAGNKPNVSKPAGVPVKGPKASPAAGQSAQSVYCTWEVVKKPQSHVTPYVKLWNNTADKILAGSRISFMLTDNGRTLGNYAATLTKRDEVPPHGSKPLDYVVNPAPPNGTVCSITSMDLVYPPNPAKNTDQQKGDQQKGDQQKGDQQKGDQQKGDQQKGDQQNNRPAKGRPN